MIHEVSGDIFLSGAQVLAHGVALNDHFSDGLALAFRERWPDMARDFRHYVRTKRPDPGTIWAWPTQDGRRVVNLITQEGEYGQGTKPGPAHIEYVRRALHVLREFIKEERISSVALPKLATGVGALEWDSVQRVIMGQLGGLAIPVFVYATYYPGIHAEESLVESPYSAARTGS